MKKLDFIISGLGGQGILFITKILSLSAIQKGYQVLAAETHGMAQRGGSVVSHLRIGNAFCSLIKTRTADVIISLEENEALRNLPFLKEGGELYTNATTNCSLDKKIIQYLCEQNIKFRNINASSIVQKMSAPLALNLAVLGYFFSFNREFFSKDDIRTTIEKISPKKFKKPNLEIFDLCSKYNQAK